MSDSRPPSKGEEANNWACVVLNITSAVVNLAKAAGYIKLFFAAAEFVHSRI